MTVGIFGLQTGVLTVDDVEEVVKALLHRTNHPGIVAIGALMQMAAEKRKDECLALAVYLLSTTDPLEAPNEDVTAHQFSPISLRLVRACSPRSMRRWAEHMLLSPENGKVESARVSGYLVSILVTIEDFFGERGLLLLRRDL